MSKVDEKVKGKGKDRSKEKDDKGKKKETCTCNHCRTKGHIEVNCWKKNPLLKPEKFKGKKTEKAGAAVEEEHLLSLRLRESLTFVTLPETIVTSNKRYSYLHWVTIVMIK